MPKPVPCALAALAKRLEAARRGERIDLVKAAADEWGVHWKTVHSWLNKGDYRHSIRKPRSDAGKSSLTYEEALKIAARLQGGMSLADAIKTCRQAGEIKAIRIDEKTGEAIPLSDSAIRRALLDYDLYEKHPSEPQGSTFAGRLKEEQNRLGLNQAKSGARQSDAAYLAEIAAAGADVGYILTGKPSVALKPDEMALLDNYRHSTEEGKEAVKKTASALAQQDVKGETA
jgi:hypothetical protein